MEQRRSVTRDATEALRAENFDELEKTAEEFRTKKTRLPSGYWKLFNFYEGLASPHRGATGEDWKVHLARVEKWRTQHPQSITAHTALAGSYVQYAWEARGSGYANKVTKEGRELFKQRLDKAKEYVDAARKLPATDPQLDVVTLRMARGLGWDWAKYDAVFHAAVKREPQYMYLYFEKATYALPRWNGSPGDVERFASQTTRMTQAAEGKACTRGWPSV